MSTSPYFDGSTSVVRYNVQRAGTARPGVTSYTRERDFPRTTRYNSGIGYNSRGYDYPYDSYDLTLAEQREVELEEMRLAEYRRNEYPRAGGATIITTGAGNMRGGKTMYLSSGRSGVDRYPLGYSPGVRTVSVERSGPVIHRAATRYTNQPVDYAFGEYATDYDGLPLQAIRVPASSGGRIRQYPTRYDSRRVFGAPLGYGSDYREPLVVVPAGRTRRYH